MESIRRHLLVAVLAAGALPLPALAQRVRIESEGQAYVQAEARTLADAALRDVIPAPPAGRGQVVFFRSTRAADASVTYHVADDDTALSPLASGTFFVAVVPPGPHRFTLDGGASLALAVEADRTYFVRARARGPRLVRSDAAMFRRSAGPAPPPVR